MILIGLLIKNNDDKNYLKGRHHFETNILDMIKQMKDDYNEHNLLLMISNKQQLMVHQEKDEVYS